MEWPAIDTTGHVQTRLDYVSLGFELVDIPIGRDQPALEEGPFRACQPGQKVTGQLDCMFQLLLAGFISQGNERAVRIVGGLL